MFVVPIIVGCYCEHGKEVYMPRDRRDGKFIPMKGDFKAIFPYLLKRRCDSLVFTARSIEVDNLVNYVHEQRKLGNRISIFQIITIAMVKTLQERPEANRFIIGRRLYEHRDYEFSFMTKLEFSDEAPETSIKIKFDKEDVPRTIMEKLANEIEVAKTGNEDERGTEGLINFFTKLPRFLLRFVIKILEKMDFYFGIPKFIYDFDPLHCSVYIANLGSINLDAEYHHLYEWGNCSIFMTIGKIKTVPVLERNGELVPKKYLEFKFSMDERITDGFYMVRTLDLFKHYLLNPHELNIEFGSAQ